MSFKFIFNKNDIHNHKTFDMSWKADWEERFFFILKVMEVEADLTEADMGAEVSSFLPWKPRFLIFGLIRLTTSY